MKTRRSEFDGWIVSFAISAGLAMMLAILIPMANDQIDALRLALRATARSSLLLFLLAFAGTGLARRLPSPFTAWLLRNRRQIGVGFAISHLLHLAAIVWLARSDPALFAALTTPASYIFGGLGYIFIVAMLATSFDATARKLGPRAWARLHWFGSWYIWLMFVINFGKRIPQHPTYIAAILLAVLALGVRLSGKPGKHPELANIPDQPRT